MVRRSQVLMLIVLGSLLWAANGWAQVASPDPAFKAAILEAFTAKLRILDTGFETLFQLQEPLMTAYYQRLRSDTELKTELSLQIDQIKTLGSNLGTSINSPFSSTSCSSIADCAATLSKLRGQYYAWRSKELGECLQQLLANDAALKECR